MMPTLHLMNDKISAGAPRRRWLLLWLLLALGWAPPRAHALQGALGVHDPSTIVKSGNTYWVFATGQGIYSMYSTDLVKWTPGPRALFVNNAYPSWINTKVPGFTGNFWAPECVYQNGKYYLYYSCSTFGSKVSTIGLATNATLDPTSPNYRWVDEGEVISTTSTSPVNAIDPAIFRDASNNLWLTYGSFFGGIRITQLDAATGKPLGTTQAAVANGGVEASYVKQHGSWYYLFINRGTCCQGTSSTYYIQVGRSASPTGPFLDKTGADLNNNGGTLLLNASGRYIGPGHTGIFEENGSTYFSHHYYDGYDAGAPKLGLAQLTWDAAGWPVVSRDWVRPGRYEIATPGNGLVWAAGCASGPAITQAARTGQPCQQWDFTALGNGDYKITSAQGGQAASVANCSDANGALLQLSPYAANDCQQYHLDRASDNTLTFASLNGNRVVEVPFASANAGVQLGLFDYNGCTCQHWNLVSTALGTAASQLLPGLSIYPVPAGPSGFAVALEANNGLDAPSVAVFNLHGQLVYRQDYSAQQTSLLVTTPLAAGLYLVRVQRGAAVATQKIAVQ
ncbi:family 43 glycosylhydrolase [Hymenobacter terrigena]